MNAETSPRAWPFLIARGRERGYRVLLAPDFLVAGRDHGVLDDSIVPADEYDRASVTEVVTRAGRALTVVHATHPVTAADIAEPGEPRDRHGRPLRLIYGFVCAAAGIGEPDPGDLAACREAALGVYRRFLGDEDGFTVAPSAGFAPRTRLTPRPPAPRSDTGGRDEGGRRPAHVNLLVLGMILLVAIVLALVWLTSQKPRHDVVCPTPNPTSLPTTTGDRLPSSSPSGCPTEPRRAG